MYALTIHFQTSDDYWSFYKACGVYTVRVNYDTTSSINIIKNQIQNK